MFKKIVLSIIKFYQLFISPNFNSHCRFYPTCSEYAILAIKKYGLAKGCWGAVKRILKCAPWSLGGVDIP